MGDARRPVTLDGEKIDRVVNHFTGKQDFAYFSEEITRRSNAYEVAIVEGRSSRWRKRLSLTGLRAYAGFEQVSLRYLPTLSTAYLAWNSDEAPLIAAGLIGVVEGLRFVYGRLTQSIRPQIFEEATDRLSGTYDPRDSGRWGGGEGGGAGVWS